MTYALMTAEDSVGNVGISYRATAYILCHAKCWVSDAWSRLFALGQLVTSDRHDSFFCNQHCLCCFHIDLLVSPNHDFVA